MPTDDQSDARGFERNRFEPAGALASTAISVLRDKRSQTATGFRQFVLDHLVRAVQNGPIFDAKPVLHELLNLNVSVEDVIDIYIPGAACKLGTDWVDDVIGFSDVTIGSLRLQSVLREAAMAVSLDMSEDDTRLSALIVVPFGEQHFLGASVLAEQLRRLRCLVSLSNGEAEDSMKQRILDQRPDMVLVTCSRIEALDGVCETVKAIRAVLPKASVIGLGGAVLNDETELLDRTGVDIVTETAQDVMAHFAIQQTAQRRA